MPPNVLAKGLWLCWVMGISLVYLLLEIVVLFDLKGFSQVVCSGSEVHEKGFCVAPISSHDQTDIK